MLFPPLSSPSLWFPKGTEREISSVVATSSSVAFLRCEVRKPIAYWDISLKKMVNHQIYSKVAQSFISVPPKVDFQMIFYEALTFKTVEKIMLCDYSNETFAF